MDLCRQATADEDNCANSSGLKQMYRGYEHVRESRLIGLDVGDWLVLVVGLALAGSLTLIIYL